MKTRVMAVALLIATALISAYAQSGSTTGNSASKRPTPTAGNTTGTGQGGGSTTSQSAAEANNSPAGSGSTGKLSAGKTSGQGSAKHRNKTGNKSINQQAAGVPNKGSAAQLRTGQHRTNQ